MMVESLKINPMIDDEEAFVFHSKYYISSFIYRNNSENGDQCCCSVG